MGHTLGHTSAAGDYEVPRSGLTKAERRPWPADSFRWIPPLEEAVALASQVREHVWGLHPCEPVPVDLSPLLVAGKFILAEANLAVDRGGHEAIMFPDPDGQLIIRVDARPKQPWGTTCDVLRQQISRHRLRFRVAHEVAHSFFYERDTHGARRRRSGTPAEERFCDHFAGALLLPDAAAHSLPPTAASVLTLHEGFNVSVEVAARRLAEIHQQLDVAIGFWPERVPRTPEYINLQWSNDRLADWGVDGLRAALTDEGVQWEELSSAHPRPPRRQVVVVGRYVGS